MNLLRRLNFVKGDDALAAALRASVNGGQPLLMVVYHRGHRANIRRMDDGFQPTPWKCLRCGGSVPTPDDLRYAWVTDKVKP